MSAFSLLNLTLAHVRAGLLLLLFDLPGKLGKSFALLPLECQREEPAGCPCQGSCMPTADFLDQMKA